MRRKWTKKETGNKSGFRVFRVLILRSRILLMVPAHPPKSLIIQVLYYMMGKLEEYYGVPCSESLCSLDRLGLEGLVGQIADVVL